MKLYNILLTRPIENLNDYINIHVNQKHYYLLSSNTHIKTFAKSYENRNKEVYIVNNKTITYIPFIDAWHKTYYNKDTINELRHIIFYIDFKSIFMNFYLQELLIKDVFIYIMTLYKLYKKLPNRIYSIV